jgi:hypothetical protein
MYFESHYLVYNKEYFKKKSKNRNTNIRTKKKKKHRPIHREITCAVKV